MDTSLATGKRTTRLVASIAATVALVASGAASASLAQDPSPMPSSAPVINGWIGARGGPAGLYSYTVGSGWAWMHNVSVEGSGPVEITFRSAHLEDDENGTPTYRFPEARDADGDVAWGGPYPEVPERVRDEHIQTWIMDVDGTRVVVTITSHPDTSAALLAEGEAIVRSIYVEPEPRGTGVGRRVVFTLPSGWDSG
jgi:hypothetical protein